MRWSPCPYSSAPASLHPSSGLHPHLQSKWMTPAGVGWLMLGPVRWHWQLNYPTGHGCWLSVEKSSGHPSLASYPQSPICLPLCPPPRTPVTPCQESDAFSKLTAQVLLTGNLNNNNYHHYWCHKQVAHPKLGQQQRLSNSPCKAIINTCQQVSSNLAERMSTGAFRRWSETVHLSMLAARS